MKETEKEDILKGLREIRISIDNFETKLIINLNKFENKLKRLR